MITKLDIVNQMLATMGEYPLNELPEDHDMVAAALNAIDMEVINILSERKWWFNYEVITLNPDTETGMIYYPEDAMTCDPVGSMMPLPDISMRDRRLYNNDTNTFVFDKPLECEIQRFVPYDDLPLLAKQAVMWNAVLSFQMNYDADGAKTQIAAAKAQNAMINLRKEHTRTIRPNLLRKADTAYRLWRAGGQAYYR